MFLKILILQSSPGEDCGFLVSIGKLYTEHAHFFDRNRKHDGVAKMRWVDFRCHTIHVDGLPICYTAPCGGRCYGAIRPAST